MKGVSLLVPLLLLCSCTVASGALTGAVLGIDLGSDNCVVAIARKKGVDIVPNEASQRSTPSIVSFGSAQRFIGEAGSTQRVSNLKNTVPAPKLLVGSSMSDEEFKKNVASRCMYELVESEGGEPAAKVSLCGSEKAFTPTQMVAMQLFNLKEIAHTDHGSEVVDVVISVPAFFTESQRQSIKDAAKIAGLNCLRVINDNTATALSYGITKTDLPEDKAKNVVFLDCGYSCLQVSVVSFKKGQLQVLSHAFEKDFGGQYVDDILFDHFAEEFTQRFKVDARTNNRATIRLRAQCEKLKKTLSANPVDLDTPINVECMMEDTDCSGMMQRGTLEDLMNKKDFYGRLSQSCDRALSLAGLTKDKIDSVEVVGGSSRIPSLKSRVSEIFGKPCSTTVNAAESVSRGASLACAMLSPAFRVREFKIKDWVPFPMKLSCSDESGNHILEHDIPQGEESPNQAKLTLNSKGPVKVDWQYSDPSTLPSSTQKTHVATHVIQLKGSDQEQKIRLEMGTDLDGCASVASAQLETEQEVPVEPPKAKEDKDSKKDDKPGETDMKDAEEGGEKAPEQNPPDSQPQTKLITRLEKLAVDQVYRLGLSTQDLEAKKQEEFDMELQDRVVQETHDAKNRLEAYVYNMRDALSGRLSDFESEDAKSKFMKTLDGVEEWLYGDGEEASKGVFVDKLKQLTDVGDPIEGRARDREEIPQLLSTLRKEIEVFAQAATTDDKAYEHITAEERGEVTAKCGQAHVWAEEKAKLLEDTPKAKSLPFNAGEVKAMAVTLAAECSKIMNKPKPKPAPKEEPKADGKDEVKPEAEAAADKDEANADGDNEMKDEKEGEAEPVDLDKMD